MSAENCPFEIIREDDKEDTRNRKNDRYVSFEIKIGEEDDAPTVSQEFKKLDSTNPEDVLLFIEHFDDLVDTLETEEGAPRFKLIKALLAGDPAKKWKNILNEVTDRNQRGFENCIEKLLLSYMDQEISLDTKDWLQSIKKPRNMKVQDFLARIRAINDLITFMPYLGTATARIQPAKFTDPELAVILRKSGPKHWRDSQIKANLKNLNINEQANYYSSLKRVDDDSNYGNRNQNNNKKKNKGKKIMETEITIKRIIEITIIIKITQTLLMKIKMILFVQFMESTRCPNVQQSRMQRKISNRKNRTDRTMVITITEIRDQLKTMVLVNLLMVQGINHKQIQGINLKNLKMKSQLMLLMNHPILS